MGSSSHGQANLKMVGNARAPKNIRLANNVQFPAVVHDSVYMKWVRIYRYVEATEVYEAEKAKATIETPTITKTAYKAPLVIAQKAPEVPATTTTVSKAPVVTSQPRIASYSSSGCQGHTMSTTAAHNCWDGLIDSYSWPHSTAFLVMYCESTGNSSASNDHSTAHGLFQVLNGSYDPSANVAEAYSMWSSRGWEPWTASEGCW